MPGFGEIKWLLHLARYLNIKYKKGLQEEVDRAKTNSFNNDLHIKRK